MYVVDGGHIFYAYLFDIPSLYYAIYVLLIPLSLCHDNQINFYKRAYVVLSFGRVKNLAWLIKSANLEPC